MSISNGKKNEMYKSYDSRVSEDETWVPPIKQRRRFSPEESHILEKEYDINSSPTQEKIQKIANSINTPRKIVTTWFQNRRAKNKRKEKIKMKENTACNSTISTSVLYPPTIQSMDYDIEDIDPLNKESENSSSPDVNDIQTFTNIPLPTSPSILLSPSEFSHFYRTKALNQSDSSQTINPSSYSLNHPTLVFDNNGFIKQNYISDTHPSYSFEETGKMCPSSTDTRNSFSTYIPFYKSNGVVSGNSLSLSPHTCIKPTDLLLEYYSDGEHPLLNTHEQDSRMANIHSNISNSTLISYEEIMPMESLDVPLNDQ